MEKVMQKPPGASGRRAVGRTKSLREFIEEFVPSVKMFYDDKMKNYEFKAFKKDEQRIIKRRIAQVVYSRMDVGETTTDALVALLKEINSAIIEASNNAARLRRGIGEDITLEDVLRVLDNKMEMSGTGIGKKDAMVKEEVSDAAMFIYDLRKFAMEEASGCIKEIDEMNEKMVMGKNVKDAESVMLEFRDLVYRVSKIKETIENKLREYEYPKHMANINKCKKLKICERGITSLMESALADAIKIETTMGILKSFLEKARLYGVDNTY
ncbi:MAG: hypothetical protein AB1468_00685 [Candidatus Micrarchaeota archaeon]